MLSPTLPSQSPVVDLAELCTAPMKEMYERSATQFTASEVLELAEIAPGLMDVQYDTDVMQGRQWLCRPRSDLGVLISALTRTPALHYTMVGDGMIMVQLRLSGYAVHDEQLDESTALAAITCFPPGSRLSVRLPRVGPWYTMAVFGKLEAIDRQWGLGSALVQALDHTPGSLQQSTRVVRKPVKITQGAIDLLRDILSFRFSGVVARAYVEARAQQLLCEVLAALDASHRPRPLPARTRQLVQRARVMLTKNPEHHHTLQSLSRSLGLNRTLLAEGFQAEFGETVFAFLQRERLRRAWVLLEDSGERVAAVAAQVGYKDATSFTRAFKAHYGITPRHVGRSSARRHAQ